ncbi:MAG: polyprenyl synthetase family protein [Bacteroidetes bacterium]|nr:polyprenyl synthetase family protein [Bacteroidota bacterium]
MSVTLNQIKAPITAELEIFEKKFRENMKSRVALLDVIMNYIVKRKGKQMRPVLVLLSSYIFNSINEKSYRGAALVELLHTATLVHDDVVDVSYTRRGFFSINALWKNKIAVLVGDYLLSKGLLLALKNHDYDLLTILSEAVEAMSEGELSQIERARRLDITEEIYFEIITQKTASLFASCCAIGAASTGTSNENIDKMKNFGLNAGIAFQIKDDLFDYGNDNIGKPTSIDIKERKMTLPLIYSLNNSDKTSKQKTMSIIKNNSKNKTEIKYVLDFVEKNGGIEYAINKMNDYKNKSVEILNSLQKPEKTLYLKHLVEYVVERKL